MLKTKNVLVVLVFSLVLRAFIEIALGNVDVGQSAYYSNLFIDAAMYLLMAILLYSILRSENKRIFGELNWKISFLACLFGLGMAFLLLAFTLGENAMEVIIVSKFNPAKAFSYWHFHEESLKVYSFLSMRVSSYILVSVVLAPLLEEFVFRVLLLETLSKKMGVWGGILTGSLLFTALHFSSHYYFSTFIFSITLYLIFIMSRSLLLCTLIHGSFNLFAFLHQYYFDIQWTRTVQELSNVSNWIPQLVMLITSLIIIIITIIINRIQLLSTVKMYTNNLTKKSDG